MKMDKFRNAFLHWKESHLAVFVFMLSLGLMRILSLGWNDDETKAQGTKFIAIHNIPRHCREESIFRTDVLDGTYTHTLPPIARKDGRSRYDKPLESLNLKDCKLNSFQQIESILHQTFSADMSQTLATSVKKIDLSSNFLPFHELEKVLNYFTHLEMLFVTDSKIPLGNWVASPSLIMSPHLSLLCLKSSGLTSIDDNILPESLTWLILTNNTLTELPPTGPQSSGQYGPNLIKMALSSNKIQRLPDHFEEYWKKLELIRLSHNELDDDSIRRLYQLPSMAYFGLGIQHSQYSSDISTALQKLIAQHHLPNLAIRHTQNTDSTFTSLGESSESLSTYDHPRVNIQQKLGTGASGTGYLIQFLGEEKDITAAPTATPTVAPTAVDNHGINPHNDSQTNIHNATRPQTNIHNDTQPQTNIHNDTQPQTNIHNDTRPGQAKKTYQQAVLKRFHSLEGGTDGNALDEIMAQEVVHHENIVEALAKIVHENQLQNKHEESTFHLRQEHSNMYETEPPLSSKPKNTIFDYYHDTGLIMKYLPNPQSLAHPPNLFTISRDVYNKGDGLDVLLKGGKNVDNKDNDNGNHTMIQQTKPNPIDAYEILMNLLLSLARAGAYLHGNTSNSLSNEIGLAHGDMYGHNILIGDNTAMADNNADGRVDRTLELPKKVMLSDFGASFFYLKSDDTAALAIEGMEVRAWAILALENILRFISPNDENTEWTEDIFIGETLDEFQMFLKEKVHDYRNVLDFILRCWKPQDPQLRPRFDEIVQRFEKLSYML